MSLTAIILILISAFTHAGWNLLSKRSKTSGAFFFFSTGFAMFCFSPIIILFRKEITLIPFEVWKLVFVTGFFMALYYFSLAGAYRKGDISIAYPIARSSPILVVTFVSFVLGKADEIGSWALVGIIMVVMGCFLLPVKHLKRFSFKNYMSICCALAFLAAVGTAGYTIIDDHSLFLMRNLPGKPFNSFNSSFLYLFLEGVSCFFWLGLGTIIIGNERRGFIEFCHRGSRDIKLAMAAGVIIFGTYGLVLTSMAFVRNVSYVAAFRQLSIPIGAFFGMSLLGEPRYPTRITGILIIMAGLILVGLG
jgi:drug/metabolite transporter (DMT)-like permease